MIGLVDADIIVFRAGFAAEKNQWFLSVGDAPPEVFAYKKDAVARLDTLLPGIHSREEGRDYQLWAEKYVEPVENALHNVNTMMDNILEKCDLTEFDVKCYLSSGKTFRHELAVTKPYKGNRDDSHRPTHEEAIRHHIIKKWETEVCDGIEADDAMGIAQCTSAEETCIITLDKDLDMIPGLHYNFVQDIHYDVNKETAWKTFCVQLLTGDSTDNIPGLKGVGTVKANKMLDGLPMEDWLEECARQYASRSGKEDWFAYLTEQASLVWILRDQQPAIEPMLAGFKTLGGSDDGTISTSLFD
jgi:hypothetical protein